MKHLLIAAVALLKTADAAAATYRLSGTGTKGKCMDSSNSDTVWATKYPNFKPKLTKT